jgi:hypothetical protein
MILATLRREVNQFTKLSARVGSRTRRAILGHVDECVEKSLAGQGKVTFPPHIEGDAHVRLNLGQSGPFIGIGGLAVAAFLYGYSAIALPSVVHSIVLPLVWLVLFVLACAWFVRRPVTVAVLPVVAIVLWFVVMLAAGSGG